MFDLRKKKKNINICSPAGGECVDISECSDPTFAEKILGDGFLVKPQEEIICSPCDGMISMIFPTLHAFGIKTLNGKEILVHIGVNTVNLNGNGFEQLAEINTVVKQGTPVIRCRLKEIQAKGYDSSTMVILTDEKNVDKFHIGEHVNMGDVIIEDA